MGARLLQTPLPSVAHEPRVQEKKNRTTARLRGRKRPQISFRKGQVRQMRMYVCVYVSVCIYIHTVIHTCMHAYMHTYMNTCVHTYMHTYTYIGAVDTYGAGQRDAYTAPLPAVLPAQLAAPFVPSTSTSHRHASRCCVSSLSLSLSTHTHTQTHTQPCSRTHPPSAEKRDQFLS